MENNTNLTDPQENIDVNLGAHDPKIDLVRNKNLFRKSLYVAGGFVLILVIICTLQYCTSNSGKTDMSRADLAMMTATDSTATAQAIAMYNTIANESNNTPAQRAKVYSAGQAYSEGNYEEALSYIKDVKTQSPVVQSLKYCLEGDCYVNLDQVDNAIDAFNSAVAEANDNPQLAPYALTKLANAYRYKGDYQNQLKTLKELLYKFPAYNPRIKAEIARAEALAAQQ
ncbi:MAG: tetratricopeptide repeat protein [Muribaculaceae bacterium]|nr:tetratricopeptide repeat protein [Muribaculaceae bacterium]